LKCPSRNTLSTSRVYKVSNQLIIKCQLKSENSIQILTIKPARPLDENSRPIKGKPSFAFVDLYTDAASAGQ
jgi:hypothetical protein